MSSSRGVAGAAKPRSQLVNSSVYSGRSHVGGRAAGPLGKHALQTLGKPTAIVRRMPPPATLPSLKAEHGHEVNIVAQGGQGWNKSIDNSNDTKNQAADNSTLSSSGAPDLRPTWAKSAAAGAASGATASVDPPVATMQSQRQANKPGGIASAASNREFPTLAASLATPNKQSGTAPTNAAEGQRIQKSARPEDTNGPAQEPIPVAVPLPLTTNTSGYIGATVRTDPNRTLPGRYRADTQEGRSTKPKPFNLSQRLNRLSMESKEAPSTPTDKTTNNIASSERQQSVPPVSSETSSTAQTATEMAEPPTAQLQPPPMSAPIPLASVSLMQQQVQPPPATGPESQDVRRYYHHQQQPQQHSEPMPDEPPPPMGSWERDGYGEEEYAAHHNSDYRGDYRNEVSSNGPPPPPQPLLGRADTGAPSAIYGHRGPATGVQQMRSSQQQPPPPQRLGAAVPPQRSRYDEGPPHHQQHQISSSPQPLMSQRYGAGSTDWDSPVSGGGGPPHQNWNMPSDERMEAGYPPREPAVSTRARPDASANNWYSQPPGAHQQQRRNDPNGWNYSQEYDNYHAGRAVSNRSRTTSNSYGGEEYEPAAVYSSYKRRATEMPEEARYDYGHAEGGYDRQKYHHDYDMYRQSQSQQQQPAYRMLKRNDEKSAEYFSNHSASMAPVESAELSEEESAATLSQITRFGRTSKPSTNFGSMNSEESPEAFESSMERKSSSQISAAQQKFNRAPGKPSLQADNPPSLPQDMPAQHYAAPKPASTQQPALKPIVPVENVWKKRENQLKQQQEEKTTWQHIKQHRMFDNNFPAMSVDKKSDSAHSEQESLSSSQNRGQPSRNSQPSSQRQSSVNQRAPTSWDDRPAWNDEYAPSERGVSADTPQPGEDDVYEGTRREFYNRQRGGGPRPQQPPAQQQYSMESGHRTQKPNAYESTGEGSDSSRRPQAPVRAKRQEPSAGYDPNADNFSNMGEFHAEDYKIEELRAPPPPLLANRFDDAFDSKQGAQKDDYSRLGGNRQGGARKTLHSDERNRQLKPQRASGTRTWQRQPKTIAEESGEQREEPLEGEGQSQHAHKRSFNSNNPNPRVQRPNQGENRQQRPQQQTQAGRRNVNSNRARNLAPQPYNNSEQQGSGKVIKSPARSENGVDEWETASESSDLHGRKSEAPRKTAQQNRPKQRDKGTRETNGTGKSSAPSETHSSKDQNAHGQSQDQKQQRPNAGQKNGKPASHTFQDNGAFVKNSSEQHTKQQNQPLPKHALTNVSVITKKNARDNRSSLSNNNNDQRRQTVTTTKDGLAGVDINDASVVVIDDNQRPNGLLDSNSDSGDFEEVISRKTKRQRQHQLEEERAIRERQKANEQRKQQQREAKQQSKKSSTGVGKKSASSTTGSSNDRNDETIKPMELAQEHGDHQVGVSQPPTVSSSLSPLSAATDSGLAAAFSSSTSPPPLPPAQASEEAGTRMNINVHQNAVWNSPSPRVANPATTLPDEPEFQTVMPSPIARPKQRMDSEAKIKLPPQSASDELPTTFGAKKRGADNPNYTFGYEHPINNDHVELQEKLNMAKIKDFWPGESDDYIGGGGLFKPSLGKSVALQEQTAKSRQQQETDEKISAAVNGSLEREDANRSKSQSSAQRPFSNSQSPLSASATLFGGHGSAIYPLNSTHYNSITPYSFLLADSGSNGRDFLLNGPTTFVPTHTSSPPIQLHTAPPPPSQNLVDARSLGSFVNPTKVYVASGNAPSALTNATIGNEWAPNSNIQTVNTTKLMHPITSPSPLQLQNAFNTANSGVPSSAHHQAAVTGHFQSIPPSFQPIRQSSTVGAPTSNGSMVGRLPGGPPPPPPMNHTVPPPPIGKFAPSFPPPTFIPTAPRDFRFPPPPPANPQQNANYSANGRNPIPTTFPHTLSNTAPANLVQRSNQRRPSQGGPNGRQNSSPLSVTSAVAHHQQQMFIHLWNGGPAAKSTNQPFGLF